MEINGLTMIGWKLQTIVQVMNYGHSYLQKILSRVLFPESLKCCISFRPLGLDSKKV